MNYVENNMNVVVILKGWYSYVVIINIAESNMQTVAAYKKGSVNLCV